MTGQSIRTKQDLDKRWPWAVTKIRLNGYIKPLKMIGKERRFHALAVGTSKSGTHSLTGLFQDHYRALHEPSAELLNKLIIDYKSGRLGEKEIQEFYILRERSSRLELESNAFNYLFVGLMADAFPEAKFIHLYRDPYSWLNSWVNHTLSRREKDGSIWADGLKAMYEPKRFEYMQQEQLLRELDLFPIDCYLNYWQTCNERLFSSIPSSRRLVIRTDEISQSVERISDYLGISPDTLNSKKSHEFKAAKDHSVLSRLDQNFLQGKIKKAESSAVYQSLERISAA